MSYSPSAAAQAIAAAIAANLANATAPGPWPGLQNGIAASGSPQISPLPLEAVIDGYLAGLGLQIESNNALSANSSTSASFVDVPGSSITFAAPVGKTYLVHCDFALFKSAGTDTQTVRLVVNGSAGPSLFVNINTIGEHFGVHLMHAAACAAGNNTIKLQWQAGSGATINVNTSSYANYVISG